MLIKFLVSLALCASVSFAPERPDIGKMPAAMLATVRPDPNSGNKTARESYDAVIITDLQNIIKTEKLGEYSPEQLQDLRKNPKFRELVDKILGPELIYSQKITNTTDDENITLQINKDYRIIKGDVDSSSIQTTI